MSSELTGIACPSCDHRASDVINSRPASNGRSIRRRRVCCKCAERFTTYECFFEPTISGKGALASEARELSRKVNAEIADMQRVLKLLDDVWREDGDD